jgi:signal transduction histidine kinase
MVGISVRGVGGSVIFEVRDTGRGIPAEHAHRIFERFYRVVQKDGPTGAGLGLAISREIVQAHGGRIWFTSDGGGSVFSFSMPVVGDDRQNDAGTASCLVGGAGGETV